MTFGNVTNLAPPPEAQRLGRDGVRRAQGLDSATPDGTPTKRSITEDAVYARGKLSPSGRTRPVRVACL